MGGRVAFHDQTGKSDILTCEDTVAKICRCHQFGLTCVRKNNFMNITYNLISIDSLGFQPWHGTPSSVCVYVEFN